MYFHFMNNFDPLWAPILTHYELADDLRLNKKFEDLSDTKLPELTNELIKTIAEAGVQPQLLPEEGDYLIESVNNFIQATQKRGI